MTIREPAKNPCGSCPYRQDVPSGVWAPEEYEKLPPYDKETFEQPLGIFMCHQKDERVCAGWAGCHDMSQSMALRVGASMGRLPHDLLDALYAYETPVPLWSSGEEAAAHGMAEVEFPDEKANRVITRLVKKGVATRE